MTLTGADVFFGKCHSVEAIRESLQTLWEACLPRRKRQTPKATDLMQNQYFVPDLSKPVFVQKRKEDTLTEPKLIELKRLEREAETAEPRRKVTQRPDNIPTTYEVLHWRTKREAPT